MSDPGSGVTIHPLAVLNIADHFTRVNVGNAPGTTPSRVFGLLFGTQDGRNADICSSVEILCTHADGKYTIRQDIMETSMKLYVEVFPKHELLGWYSTGSQIEPGDVEIHRSVSGDGLWYLFLSTAGGASDKELPITIHALETHLVDGVARTEFCQHRLTVATSEMERLTLDHVSSVHSAADTESAMKRQLDNAVTAVESLSDRIGVVVQYLRQVQSGAVKPDPASLRQLSALCARLPVTTDDITFESHAETERQDTLLLSCLASVTKGAHALAEMSRKLELTTDKKGKGLESFPGYP